MSQMSYPLDKTPYNADGPQLWLSTRTRGVYSSNEDLICTAVGGMRIQVSPGMAWLKLSRFAGVAYGNLSTWMVDLAYADGVLDRIDRVVVRWSAIENTVELFVKQGAFSSNPVAPPIEEHSNTTIIPDIVEIAICDVLVRHGAVEITNVNITDQRLNEALCGVMRDGVTGIPTNILYSQFNAWFDQFRDDNTATFEEWLSGLQDLIDEDIAGKLLSEIVKLQVKFSILNLPIVDEITLSKTSWVAAVTTQHPDYAGWYQSTWSDNYGRLRNGQFGTFLVNPKDRKITSPHSVYIENGKAVFFAPIIPLEDVRIKTLFVQEGNTSA